MKDNDLRLLPVPVFERSYKESHGHTAFLDIDLVLESLPGVRLLPGRPPVLEINDHFILGNEIVEVVKRRGGVIQLDSFYAAYKSSTGKNLDPTAQGCASLESLIASYDHLLSLRGRSIILRSVDTQLTARAQARPDLIAGTRDNIAGTRDNIAGTRDNIAGTRDNIAGARDNIAGARDNIAGTRDNIAGTRDNIAGARDTTPGARDSSGCRLYQLATCQPGGSSLVSSALRSVRQETMFKGAKLKLTDCIASKEPASPVTKRVTMKQEEPEVEAEDMVMMSTNSRDIVTVDTDTSDAESVYSVKTNNSSSSATTTTTCPVSTRGRKKSRMAAFPFLE